MSTTFVAATKALAADPELFAKVSTASSPEGRAAHFRAAGVDVPTHADVNSHLANMAGVAGGGSTTSIALSTAGGAVVGAAAGAGAGAA